ncbi:MAG: hypothetical protein RIC38_04850 [Chromatocurvus sp.]
MGLFDNDLLGTWREADQRRVADMAGAAVLDEVGPLVEVGGHGVAHLYQWLE